ncbi:MAG TPA: PIG-L family deacetylase, partial [Acidimicrobiales bacterium]|nr:PIG-L family deacetylase [Acidimicrobiales bacterium]
MLPLLIGQPEGRSLRLLALGAHPDDIEIGAGGSLLTLAEQCPGLEVLYVVLTGTVERGNEARQAARLFLAGVDVTVELHNLPEGHLPAAWAQVKEVLENVAKRWAP